jgi:hypothetical protein
VLGRYLAVNAKPHINCQPASFLGQRIQPSPDRTIGAVQPNLPFAADVKRRERSRTTTQWELIAKRTICLAWPEPHTWIAAAIKSPSVISFLCFVSIRQKIILRVFPWLWGVHPKGGVAIPQAFEEVELTASMQRRGAD